MKLGSCSIGINPFWLGGIVGFLCSFGGKTVFRLVWLINRPQTRLVWLKKLWQRLLVPGAPGFNRLKTIEKVFSWETSAQPKPALKWLISAEHDLSVVQTCNKTWINISIFTLVEQGTLNACMDRNKTGYGKYWYVLGSGKIKCFTSKIS